MNECLDVLHDPTRSLAQFVIGPPVTLCLDYQFFFSASNEYGQVSFDFTYPLDVTHGNIIYRSMHALR